jgi:hypothetical protein
MYSIIRLIIGCIFLGCAIFALKRSKSTRKRGLYVVSIFSSVLLITVLAFLPFENLFVTFDSPAAAYKYYILGASDPELILEGDSCDFVVDREDGVDSYLVIPKTEDGWKVGIGVNVKLIDDKFCDGISVSVYRYKNTEDYFITVCDVSGGESIISDGENSEFQMLKSYNDPLKKDFATYFAHITSFSSGYSITVNGKNIVFDEANAT